MDDLIGQGINAFRAGNRDEARKLFVTAIKQNPNNERAWGWLSNVAGNDTERIDCLKQVLRINPKNEQANQLLNSLTGFQSQFELQQPQVSKQISQQTPNSIKSAQRQLVKNIKSTNTKSRRTPLILIGVFAAICFCIGGFFFVGQFFNTPNSTTPNARILSAAEVYQASAVQYVKTQGYTVTSAVCEVVSPEHFNPTFNINGTSTNIDLFQIVFHAFRITGPALTSDLVVLFATNHTARQGIGVIWAINTDAIRLLPVVQEGSKATYPITMNTTGAQTAMACARQAGKPPSLQLGNISGETWRQEAIKKFGPEQILSDGTKDDYVMEAVWICLESNTDRETMLANLGADTKGHSSSL